MQEITDLERTFALGAVENWLKVLASLALLVPGLGYPAVMVQFARRGIPISFVDNAIAIRAGLQPTLALLLVTATIVMLAENSFLPVGNN